MRIFAVALVWLGGLGIGLAIATGYWKRRLRHAQNVPAQPTQPFLDGRNSSVKTLVEVDCRACGKLNRVPSERLLEHPKCGSCKARLMPGRRLMLSVLRNEVSPLEEPIRSELRACWNDETRLWEVLAKHVALENEN